MEDILSKQMFEYNLSIRENILDICKPLFDNLGISYFEYVKISAEGNIFYLCTNKKWLEFSLEHKMFDDKEHVELCSMAKKFNQRYALWNCLNLEKTCLLSKYYEHNIWNGFSINEASGEDFNIYSFATTKENNSLNDFFVKNINLFDHYITYFKQKIKFLVSDNVLPHIKGTPLLKDTGEINAYYYSYNIERFLEEISIKSLVLKANEKKIHLTKRELLCLRLLAIGKTMKEIGNELSISPRTVESHLNVIKAKTGMIFKNQLISFYENNPIINLTHP